jgi:hypothetical protein
MDQETFVGKHLPLKQGSQQKIWGSHYEISQYGQIVKNVTVLQCGRGLTPATFKHLTEIMGKNKM